MTRREQFRASIKEEIKAIARRQMAETGTGSLSINALAREMEMTPSGFYRYYASRDDLISAMIAEAWTSLAEAMEAADSSQSRQDFVARMTDVQMAYRRWGLAHRVDFDLIFGNPIPNYQPPPEAAYTDDRSRSIGTIFRILAEALAAGALKPTQEQLTPPPTLNISVPIMADIPMPPLPNVVTYIGVMGWAHLHGILMLELHHHTQSMVSDPEAFYQNEIRFLLRSTGLLA